MAIGSVPFAQVIYSPNPLRPAADREIRAVALGECDTVQSVILRLGLAHTPLAVTLNGRALDVGDMASAAVRHGDVLLLIQGVAGIESAAITAKLVMYAEMSYAAAAVIGTVVSFAVSAAVSFALSTVASSLVGGRSAAGASRDDTPAAYSIEGGSNSARPYEPLALVLGRHRVFPDYASRPFGEFVPDPTTTTEVINNTPQTVEQVPPEFGFVHDPSTLPLNQSPEPVEPWTHIGDDSMTGYAFYGDGAKRTFRMTSGEVTRPHTFVVRYGFGVANVTTWEDYAGLGSGNIFAQGEPTWHRLGTPLPVIVRYGYEVTYNTEQLVSIFNYGFGDLAVSDRRIGANPLDQYNSVRLDAGTVPQGHGDRTLLTGYTSEGWPGDVYPGNVQTVNGGALEQHDNVLNDGWIERKGSASARYVQIDISGRLLQQSGGGMGNLSCDFEAEYQPVGSDAWKPFPFSPMTITNGSTRILRQTFSAHLDTPADNVRVRRVTPEPTDAGMVSELEFTRVKFFREGDALYPAQLREGLVIRATGQINGHIDRLSALVEMKCWVWNSDGAWDGSMPGTGGAWKWQTSVNPGYLFLYYARGGFLNATAAPPHLGLAGWLDEPHPDNSARLFGAGLENGDIDYRTIIAWAQWCTAQQLECHMCLADTKSVFTNLNTLAAAGRARVSWAPGKLSVWWEAPGQPFSAAFGASNIVAGTFKVAYDSDDAVDGYVLSYTRSDDDYEADEVRATVPGVTSPVNWQSVDAAYSMPRGQAQRLVNLLAAARHYFRRTITWESTAFGLSIATGDVIQLAHDLTRWAYSGRIVSLSIDGGRVRSVTLSAPVEAVAGDAQFWIMVTPPGGDPTSYRCALPEEPTRTLSLVDAWPATQAPGWLDEVTPNGEAGDVWQDTIPEDWTWLAGPAPTPGKRVRIVGTEPSSDRRVRITARDEVAEYYALEWGLGNVPDVASGERIVARLFNLAALPKPGGGLEIGWELDGAVGADVRVSVDGRDEQQVPIAGRITVTGPGLVLPAYAAGTRLRIHALPVAAGSPVAIVGDELELVV